MSAATKASGTVRSPTQSRGAAPWNLPRIFTGIADRAAAVLGMAVVFLAACVATLAWIVTGPLFGWGDTWQLFANTVTNVATFLMVFVLQNSQNRDGAALQTKRDEPLRALAPRSGLPGIEDLAQEEIEGIKRRRREPEGRG